MRIKRDDEVFTPDYLVKEILSNLPDKVWEKGQTFLDNSCGNGNFLVEILINKIKLGHNPSDSLKSIFGVDIMEDNVQECRMRLLKTLRIYEKITEEHIKIVCKNIFWANPEIYPNGSLDYNFEFDNFNDKEIESLKLIFLK